MSDNGYTTKSVKGTWRSEDESHTHDLPVSPSGSLELIIHDSSFIRKAPTDQIVWVQVQGRPLEPLFNTQVDIGNKDFVLSLGVGSEQHYKLENAFGKNGVIRRMYDPFSSSEFHIQPS